MVVTILNGDVREMVKSIPDGSIQTCVTSPPYFQLRRYLDPTDPMARFELGSENTPAEFVRNLVEIFGLIRPKMRDDSVLFVNLGDSYSGSGKGGSALDGSSIQTGLHSTGLGQRAGVAGIPAKNLLLIPERFAIAMQDAGWICRSRIAWAKTSAMPESVRDRPTSAWEHVWMFSKAAKYFYDAEAVRQPPAEYERKGGTAAYSGSLGPQSSRPGASLHQMSGAGASLRNFWLLGPEPNREVTQTVRQVRVAWGDVDDDTLRTPSPDCPLHGFRDHSDSSPLGDGRTAAPGDQRHSPDNGACHASGRRGGSAPTGQIREPDWSGDSSDWPRPSDDDAAIPSSTGSRRTGLVPETSSPDTPYVESSVRTGDRSESPSLFGSHGSMLGSSTAELALPTPADSRTPSGTADTAPWAEQTASTGLHDAGRIDENSTSADSVSGAHDPSVQTPSHSTDKPTCTCSYFKNVTESVSHYAAFPSEIPRRCIKAGTSEKGACPACGSPWARIVEKAPTGRRPGGNHVAPEVVAHMNGKGSGGHVGGTLAEVSNYATQTTGWAPSCTCIDAGDPVPQTVLDPFAGTFTTSLVAERLGRDSIGIDLSPAYCEIGRKRIAEDAPMLTQDAVTVEHAERQVPLLLEAT